MARAMVAGYLGRAYTLSNRTGDAIAILKEAIDAAAGMEFMVDQAMRLVHLSEAYLHDGQVERATGVAHLALQNAADHNQRGTGAWTQWLLGEINTHVKNPGTAEEHYRKAMALASECGMVPLLAHCHLGIGKGYGSKGKGAPLAHEHLVKAAGMYGSLEMPFWTHQAEASLRGLQN